MALNYSQFQNPSLQILSWWLERYPIEHSAMLEANRKTTVEHWDQAWETDIRMKLPSALDVGIRNLMWLLRRYARPGMSLLEIGFAPGKLLSWTASILGMKVSGLDYSPTGIRT